jgi:hypothetical protein
MNEIDRLSVTSQVRGQIIPTNPVASARSTSHRVMRGKANILSHESSGTFHRTRVGLGPYRHVAANSCAR